MNPQDTPQEDRPVAYDAEGRPLYAHPPKSSSEENAHKVVHMARMVEPVKQEISEELKKKHEASRRHYPFLNLSEGEYVINVVRRHPIGLIAPLAVGGLLLVGALSVLFNYDIVMESLQIEGTAADPFAATLPILLFCVLVGLGMYVAYYVFSNNRFYLTNEAVIQIIQLSLFSRREQTASLLNVEDASYRQTNFLQHLLGYGTIRLSTQGDETTYTFTYADNPKQSVAVLNNAVESFKNGRPVGTD